MTLIDELVHQFSDPMAFFRELVQNSIDSGTGEIEIDLGYADGRMEITVRDWGEGMSREIIETKLVRLFASGKDDDLTKIGRFGIGFVSVFAIEPDQIIVETGRSGENWRVLFAPDRTYELYRLPHSMEGTEIRIIKAMNDHTFHLFKTAAEESVRTWCKHAEIPVFFNGEPTAQDFDVPSLCKVTLNEQGTRVVMGFATDGEDFKAGYYNRGLTLVELNSSPWPWTSFRIDSHLLEHTLTRDQLLKDRHLERANKLLADLATKDLPARLMDALEDLALRPGVGYREAHDAHLGYLNKLISADQIKSLPRGWRTRRILTTSRGDAISLQEAQQAVAAKRLRLTYDNCAVAEATEEPRVTMLHGGWALQQLLRRLFSAILPFVEIDYLLLDDLRRSRVAPANALSSAALQLLHSMGHPVDDVIFADLSYHPNHSLRRTSFFNLPTRHDPIHRDDWAQDLQAGSTLVLNYSHDLDGDPYEPLASLAHDEPEWAALVLVESLAVRGEVNPALIDTALAMRQTRLFPSE